MNKRTQIDIYLCRNSSAKRSKKNTVYSWDDDGVGMIGTREAYEAHLEKKKSEWISKMERLDLRLCEGAHLGGQHRSFSEMITELVSKIMNKQKASS